MKEAYESPIVNIENQVTGSSAFTGLYVGAAAVALYLAAGYLLAVAVGTALWTITWRWTES